MTDISHEKQKCKFQTSHQTTRSKQRVYNAERRNHTEPNCSHLPRTHPAQVRRAHMSTSLHRVRSHLYKRAILLFTDPTMVEALPVEHFSQQASHMTHQQHLQMGLRKGMAILIYYVTGDTHYQAVLLAEESVMNRGRRGENRLWKRVTPTVTEFAWLPPNLAESFCKNALYRDAVRTYCAFDTPHLGLDTKNFVADVFVENILYLGDTRSADDLSVFTQMAPERLCLGCGLRVDEPFAPISTGERKKLFYAAQKLLTFVLHEVFFLLYAAWVRSRAERPSVSYTKVVMEVAWTGHNLQFTKTN